MTGDFFSPPTLKFFKRKFGSIVITERQVNGWDKWNLISKSGSELGWTRQGTWQGVTSEILAWSHLRKFHAFDILVCRAEFWILIMEPEYENNRGLCGIAEGVKYE